jgi:hypothetical protein
MSSSPGTRAIWGIFTVAIALVWGINGLWCKVLGGVPRHEAIVARVVDTATDIVGLDLDAAAAAAAAGVLVRVIGLSELTMVVWFVSGRWVRLNAAAQVVIVMTMNVIEQLLAPELLLFGPWNFLWASCFSAAVLVRTRLHVQRLAQEGA